MMTTTIYDDSGFPLGDIHYSHDDAQYSIYHYSSDEWFGPYETKEDAEVKIMELSYDLK